MSNKKLYIIGNGFDLHHGLETSYASFCQHVKENDRELYEFLEWYVDIELYRVFDIPQVMGGSSS